MAQLNVSQTLKRLEDYIILILDEKHAKILNIENGKIAESDLAGQLPMYEDQAGYFRSSSGGGISEESNVRSEFQRRFYKESLQSVEKILKRSENKQLVIMCPEEDQALIKDLLTNGLKRAFHTFIVGNYVKVGVNDVLEKVTEQL